MNCRNISIISRSSFAQPSVGRHSGHDILGRLKSPPIIISGVYSRLCMALFNAVIACLNSFAEDGRPWAESSGCLYTVTSNRLSIFEWVAMISTAPFVNDNWVSVVEARSFRM